jgi:hypothetical protein
LLGLSNPKTPLPVQSDGRRNCGFRAISEASAQGQSISELPRYSEVGTHTALISSKFAVVGAEMYIYTGFHDVPWLSAMEGLANAESEVVT